MKRALFAASAFLILTAGSIGAANAVDIHVGPGGASVAPHDHDRDSRDCRVVITHHVNRWGNDVTVRRRTCD